MLAPLQHFRFTEECDVIHSTISQ